LFLLAAFQAAFSHQSFDALLAHAHTLLRSPARARRTASALNSGVNFLRFRRAMNNSWRIVAPLMGLSTKLGEDQSVAARWFWGRRRGNV
jgi:hypothetical protein